MTWLIAATLVLAGIAGAIVVFSRDPKRQVFALAGNGLVLGLLFFVLQAPDVALSETAVNTVVTPLLFLVTLAAVGMNRARR
ncbi:MAG TPA: hydrogenase subunit MbhD domain-containing protein [Pirellulales bacterium]|nr:hydrogenase subunit MbhD domain-containing protein [Pirellulales bacterium]